MLRKTEEGDKERQFLNLGGMASKVNINKILEASVLSDSPFTACRNNQVKFLAYSSPIHYDKVVSLFNLN